MDIKKRLMALATQESQYPHFLSVYLHCRDGGNDKKKENLIFLKNRLAELERVLGDDKKGVEYLRQGIEKARFIRDQDIEPHTVGLALIIKGDEVIERFETSIPFENQVAYRRFPWISQLAFISEEFEPYAVVHIDSRSAHIFELALGEIIDSSGIHTEINKRIDRGGWSRVHYQRAYEDEKLGHVQDVGRELTDLVARHRYKRIVVIGSEKVRSQLRDNVPQDVGRRIIDADNVSSRAGDKELLDRAVSYFQRAEEEEESAKMDRVIREIHSSSMGVSGLEDTLTYLARGQAYEVLMDAGLSKSGTQCGDCSMLFQTSTDRCHVCESTNVNQVDLKEAVTRTALQFGSKLEFVKHDSFRSRLGGAAALLRGPRI